MKLDATHDPAATSWVESANAPDCPFPIQNLPFGVFRRKNEKPRGGVAIGEHILDLAALGLKTGPTLNGIAALGRPAWRKLRSALFKGLSAKTPNKHWKKSLVPMKKAELLLPVAVGDYSDFFTGIHHASNMGRILRPDSAPLMPNYKWVPIGYHGRSSSIVVSGTPVRRPLGQIKTGERPEFGPSRRLDYEAELGFVVGPGNPLGKSISIQEAEKHLFGVVMLNDWSARDIQAWEYQPLGPFLAKSFASTISPWIVTLEALAPYRCPAFARADGDPQPLPYLRDVQGGFDIEMAVALNGDRLSRSSFRDSYWTPAQMVAHQTSNGCNLRPGDLLGSGTISGSEPGTYGSLMEVTAGGRTGGFLMDGDEVVLSGRCARAGYATIGLGEARGIVTPAQVVKKE
jgi:fumarylacetoacetase